MKACQSEYDQAIKQAIREYKELYTTDLKFVKKPRSGRRSCEESYPGRGTSTERTWLLLGEFSFTITAFDLDKRLWDRCPGCGDPLINHDSNGHAWQGCYKCDILLGSNGVIQSMDHTKGKKPKEEPFGAKVEEKT